MQNCADIKKAILIITQKVFSRLFENADSFEVMKIKFRNYRDQRQRASCVHIIQLYWFLVIRTTFSRACSHFDEVPRCKWVRWNLHVAVCTHDRVLQPSSLSPVPSTNLYSTLPLSFSSKSYTQRNLFNALASPLRRLRLYGYFSLWAIKVNRGRRSSERN